MLSNDMMIAREYQTIESSSFSRGGGLPDLDARDAEYSLNEADSITSLLTLARGPSQSKEGAEGEI